MQRFSALVRYIFTVILVLILIPVAAHFIEEQPRETANVVLKFLFDLSEQTWLHLTALSLGCFVAGLWVDWLLRRLDRSRADERKALGTEMANLGNELGLLTDPMYQASPRIRSFFATARKLGIWVPDQRIFAMHPERAKVLIKDYLTHVGTLLRDGHFLEAKRYAAVNSSLFFDEAYEEFGLSSTQALSF